MEVQVHQVVHHACPPARVLMCAGRGGSGAASADVQTGTEATPPSWEEKE